MDFFLQVDANGAVGPDHFIGADSGGRRDVPSRVRDANVCWVVADDVMSSFDGGGYEAVKEALRGTGESVLRRREHPQRMAEKRNRQEYSESDEAAEGPTEEFKYEVRHWASSSGSHWTR